MQGRVAIITGATSGIGASAAELFAAKGCKLVLAGRRAEKGEEVAGRVRDAGGEAVFVQADMASDGDIKAMVGTALSTYGSLDYAFNNAGTGGEQQNLHEYDDDNWENVLGVNLTGVYRCMKYQLGAMLETGAKQGKGAVIVNNASTLGHRASLLSGPAYTASKHGLLGLTKQAALSYMDRNIRVNAVSPGATRTELLEPLLARGPEVARQLAEINPIGRLAEPEEVAAAAVFLCTDQAAMITGHALPVDGGQLAKL